MGLRVPGQHGQDCLSYDSVPSTTQHKKGTEESLEYSVNEGPAASQQRGAYDPAVHDGMCPPPNPGPNCPPFPDSLFPQVPDLRIPGVPRVLAIQTSQATQLLLQ